jgi:hypothetical protein
MMKVYVKRRQQQSIENLFEKLGYTKDSYHHLYHLSFDSAYTYVNDCITQHPNVFYDFHQARDCMTMTLCLKVPSQEDNRLPIVNTIPFVPITCEFVRYQVISEKEINVETMRGNHVPVCFLWNTQLEFSVITNQVAQQLGLSRYDDEKVYRVEVKGQTIHCILRFIEYCISDNIMEDSVTIRWNKMPILWSIFSNELNICYVGRRGLLPCNFIHVTPGNYMLPLIQPVILDRLRYLKDSISINISKINSHNIVEKEFVCNCQVDTTILKTDLSGIYQFSGLPIVFGDQENRTDSSYVKITSCESNVSSDSSVSCSVGWDFISYYGMLFYQGHALEDTVDNTKIDDNTSNNQYNCSVSELFKSFEWMTPIQRSRISNSLYYQSENGVLFADYFMTGYRTTSDVSLSPSMLWKQFVSIVQPSMTNSTLKSLSIGTKLDKLNCQQIISVFTCLDYEIKTNYAFIDSTIIRVLQLLDDEEQSLSEFHVHLLHTSSKLSATFPSVPMIAQKHSFPLFVISVKYILKQIIRQFRNDKSITIIQIIVECGNYRGICKVPCRVKDLSDNEDKKQSIYSSQYFSKLLNLKEQVYLYVPTMMKSKLFEAKNVIVDDQFIEPCLVLE